MRDRQYETYDYILCQTITTTTIRLVVPFWGFSRALIIQIELGLLAWPDISRSLASDWNYETHGWMVLCVCYGHCVGFAFFPRHFQGVKFTVRARICNYWRFIVLVQQAASKQGSSEIQNSGIDF